jgi:hypothetical protein
MFDSSVIDVAIGLVFVFLLLSLVASAVKEGLEAYFKRRATDLEKGIKELIGNVDDINNSTEKPTENQGSKNGPPKDFIELLYNHGLINSLYAGSYNTPNTQLPSYIPSKNFALVLMDLRNQSSAPNPEGELPQNVKQAFNAFEITAAGDVNKMQAQIEDWYNSSMDRVSGWYKRRTQYWLFGIGLLITIAVNVDCGVIARRLSTDTTLRQAAVRAAQQELKSNPRVATPPTQTSTDSSGDLSIEKIKANLLILDGVGLPLGWTDDLKQWNLDINAAYEPKNKDKKSHLVGQAYWHLGHIIASHIVGWLLTALAISLGAPFWFDMLNKIMVVRSTVKPSEKSKDEGSKDPGTPKAAASTTK